MFKNMQIEKGMVKILIEKGEKVEPTLIQKE